MWIGTVWVVVVIVLSRSGHAAPSVSIDLQPDVPGIQATRTVLGDESFVVEVVVEGVTDASPLHGYQIEIGFDEEVVEGTAISEGTFLAPSVFRAKAQHVAPARLVATTLGDAVVTGSGTLGVFEMRPKRAGVTELRLDRVLLAGRGGASIPVAGASSGMLTVPEPAVSVGTTLGAVALFVGAVSRPRPRSRS